MPSEADLRVIFSSILDAHLQPFSESVSAEAGHIVSAVIEFHRTVSEKFLPSAIKFHYNFNMREFVNVFQGLCKSSASYYSKEITMIRLWKHECARVFGD